MGPSGTTNSTPCRRTSWSAFSPMCFGRRWDSSVTKPGWGTRRGKVFAEFQQISLVDVVLPTRTDPQTLRQPPH